jgi:hypothetical protein
MADWTPDHTSLPRNHIIDHTSSLVYQYENCQGIPGLHKSRVLKFLNMEMRNLSLFVAVSQFPVKRDCEINVYRPFLHHSCLCVFFPHFSLFSSPSPLFVHHILSLFHMWVTEDNFESFWWLSLWIVAHILVTVAVSLHFPHVLPVTARWVFPDEKKGTVLYIILYCGV